MSIIRTGLVLAAVIMLLPADHTKQAELQGAAATTVEKTVSFCQRNPATCDAGSELWALFLQKAEFGMELAAGLVRAQLAKQLSAPEQPAQRYQHATQPIAPAYYPQHSLTTADRRPQWRGVPIEQAAR